MIFFLPPFSMFSLWSSWKSMIYDCYRYWTSLIIISQKANIVFSRTQKTWNEISDTRVCSNNDSVSFDLWPIHGNAKIASQYIDIGEYLLTRRKYFKVFWWKKFAHCYQSQQSFCYVQNFKYRWLSAVARGLIHTVYKIK